jgi:hypothetical protein
MCRKPIGRELCSCCQKDIFHQPWKLFTSKGMCMRTYTFSKNKYTFMPEICPRILGTLYIYIYIYTHTHTHTHTCVCMCMYVNYIFFTKMVSDERWMFFSKVLLAKMSGTPLTLLTQSFTVTFQIAKQMLVEYLKLHYNRFLLHSFQFIDLYHYRILVTALLNKQTNKWTNIADQTSRSCVWQSCYVVVRSSSD